MQHNNVGLVRQTLDPVPQRRRREKRKGETSIGTPVLTAFETKALERYRVQSER
jgi:hypothetical protein